MLIVYNKLNQRKSIMENRIWSDEDLFSLFAYGETDVAFIKSDKTKNNGVWEIYGADGTKLAATDNRECAFWVARQNDLEPKSVH